MASISPHQGEPHRQQSQVHVLPLERALELIPYCLNLLNAYAHELIRLSKWLIILSVIFIPLERLLPLHRQKIARTHLSQDLIYYFLAGIFPAMLMVIPLALVAWLGQHVVAHSILSFIQQAPWWERFIGALLATELGYYWGHRLTHEIPFLWRFHAVHHSAPQLDYLVTTHAHPLDTAFSHTCMFMPVYFLGLAAPAQEAGSDLILILNALAGVWGYFLHANMNLRLGKLEWLISTPAFHHWHHTKHQPLDRNYASMLPWLDRIFGTYHLPKHAWPQGYGIHESMPETLVGQLLHPLQSHPRQQDRSTSA